MISREILNKIRQIEIRTNRIVKTWFIFCLALVLSGVLFGCSSIRRQEIGKRVTTAINKEDWVALRKLAKPGMRANEYISSWENSARAGHSVCVGKLLNVEKDSQYYLDNQPCTTYSFALENRDGTPNPHWLQILIREEDGKSTLLDFWNFGW